MACLVSSVLIPAGLEEVFKFHTNPGNIGQVQPPGFRPSQVDFSEPLQEGSRCAITVPAPGGEQNWVVVVEKLICLPEKGYALMVDRAEVSPFSFWLHRHHFRAEEGATRMTDVVDFDPPFGRWGFFLTPFVWIFLKLLFASRHRRTVSLFGRESENS